MRWNKGKWHPMQVVCNPASIDHLYLCYRPLRWLNFCCLRPLLLLCGVVFVAKFQCRGVACPPCWQITHGVCNNQLCYHCSYHWHQNYFSWKTTFSLKLVKNCMDIPIEYRPHTMYVFTRGGRHCLYPAIVGKVCCPHHFHKHISVFERTLM